MVFDGDRIDGPLFRSSIELEPGAPALFLSDLHFGDGSRTDLFADQDSRLIELVEGHLDRVGAVVFLGDIFDLPQAWRIARIAGAHLPLFEWLAGLARRHRVIFASGNHDWSVDYAAMFPGAARCEAVWVADGVLAWHGHQVDLLMNPGVRDATAKTYAHALLERVAGQRLIPPLERYDSTANRVATAAAVGWSRLSLARASALRRLGRGPRAARIEREVRYLARCVLGDPADQFGATVRAVLGDRAEVVLSGHSHLPGRVVTDRGVYVNTGTWTCGVRSYALWSGTSFQVLDVDSGQPIADEHYRDIPADTDARDLFDWWSGAWRAMIER